MMCCVLVRVLCTYVVYVCPLRGFDPLAVTFW